MLLKKIYKNINKEVNKFITIISCQNFYIPRKIKTYNFNQSRSLLYNFNKFDYNFNDFDKFSRK